MTFYEVTEAFTSHHQLIEEYPFLPGDILVRQDDGTFAKTAPGLGLFGFHITFMELALHTRQIPNHPPISFL